MRESLDSKIEDSCDIIGMSSLGFCVRANIIKGIYNINIPLNNKMLWGILYENNLYKPKVLKALLYYIHTKLDIKDNLTKVSTIKQDFEEILPGKKLRFTPDIYTNLYCIEVKTTKMYVRDWMREIAPYYSVQLNAYLCKYKQEYGFVHLLNQSAFMSEIRYNNFYWENLWKQYGYFLPITVNHDIYEKTKKRAIYIFEHRDNKEYKNVIGPQFPWECSKCDPEIKKYCPNPIVRKKLDYFQDCDHCNNKIKKGDFALFRNELVFCEECFPHVRKLIKGDIYLD